MVSLAAVIAVPVVEVIAAVIAFVAVRQDKIKIVGIF